MKTLYLECNMGAAGDMLAAALLELHPNPTDFINRLNALNIPGTAVSFSPREKCGIRGTGFIVAVNGCEEESMDHHHEHTHAHEHHNHHVHHEHHEHHEHHHSSLHDIEHIVSAFPIPQTVRDDIMSVYNLIAQAESRAHGKPTDQIHFHEVGTMDAVADITAVCLLIHELSPDNILASPVNVGFGQVHCAHGILPVPAPATAFILEGVPIYSGSLRGEMCTPTGAALLRHFVSAFVPIPVMSVAAIGYGMGKKDFEAANCLRAILGETADASGEVTELACNLDDMTPEDIAYAAEVLLKAGALDVFTTPVTMKKGRPGVMLTCLCSSDCRNDMIRLIFKHTSTIGIRWHISGRATLSRREYTVSGTWGPIRMKESSGWGVFRKKAEFEDLKAAAEKENLSLADIRRELNI